MGSDPYFERYGKKIKYIIIYLFLLYSPDLFKLLNKISKDNSTNFKNILRKSLEVSMAISQTDEYFTLERICGNITEWVSQEDSRLQDNRSSTLKHLTESGRSLGDPDFILMYYNNFWKISNNFCQTYAREVQIDEPYEIISTDLNNIISLIEGEIIDLEIYIKRKLEDITQRKYELSITKYENDIDLEWMKDDVKYCGRECAEFFDSKKMECSPEPDCNCDCECTTLKMRLKRLYNDAFEKSGIDVTKTKGFIGKVENLVDVGMANLKTDYEVKLHGKSMMDKIEFKIAKKIKRKKIGLKNKLQNIKERLERKKRKVKEIKEKKEKIKKKWRKAKSKYKKAKKTLDKSQKGIKRFFKGAKEIIDS